jgi:hypothetical protein
MTFCPTCHGFPKVVIREGRFGDECDPCGGSNVKWLLAATARAFRA